MGRAIHFSKFLNWVAARPSAADGAYRRVLSVEPIEWTYAAEEVPALLAELNALLGADPSSDQRWILERWRDAAADAVERGLPLEFV